MTEISLRIGGVARVQQRLTQLAAQLRDFTVPNRAAAAALYKWAIDNYDSEGGLVGGWVSLLPATIKSKQKKGKEKMLVITGALRSSLLPFSTDRRAGVGSELTYAKYHQEGSGALPQREILPRARDVEEIGIQVYGFYVAKLTKEANQ